MSTPRLTKEQELRDVLLLTVRCIGELYILRVAPTLFRKIEDVLKKTEES